MKIVEDAEKEMWSPILGAVVGNSTDLFMVFAFNHYYPGGGISDFVGLALSLDQARAMVSETNVHLGRYQIVDYKTMETVEEKPIDRTN